VSRFNLIDEKWIPVQFPDGRREELGIWETLKQAKEIATIEDPSPLVVAALHRFLLAVLYRALEGPTDIDQAKGLFRSGLPIGRIEAYLEKWRSRFWLFDEEFPFGQNPNVSNEQIEPWTKLTAEYNATSNKVLFDHTSTKDPGEREPSECARWILASMSFSVSGGRGYYPSPSPNAIMCIPIGPNLERTLLFSLVPYQNREVAAEDRAQWELNPPRLPLSNPKRIPKGYADIFTWASRFLLLEETESGKIRRMFFVAGEGFENPANIRDPMQPYAVSEKWGELPVCFQEDRGTWRDFDSFLPDGAHFAPMTVEHSVRLANRDEQKTPRSILTLGLRYSPPSANLDFWRMERFILPGTLLDERSIRGEIKGLLRKADEVQSALRSALKSFAVNLLIRGDRKPDDSEMGKLKDKSDSIKNLIRQTPCTTRYWAILEAQFHEVLQSYTLERDPDEIEMNWLQVLRSTLLEAWSLLKASVSVGDAWAIRALVKAEIHISRKINELDDAIKDFQNSLAKEES